MEITQKGFNRTENLLPGRRRNVLHLHDAYSALCRAAERVIKGLRADLTASEVNDALIVAPPLKALIHHPRFWFDAKRRRFSLSEMRGKVKDGVLGRGQSCYNGCAAFGAVTPGRSAAW